MSENFLFNGSCKIRGTSTYIALYPVFQYLCDTGYEAIGDDLASCPGSLSVGTRLGMIIMVVIYYVHKIIVLISFYPANVLGENDLRCVYKELLDVSHKWFKLGVELELRLGTLERVRDQYPDPSTALLEMLLHWLKQVDPPPTWEGLACALESRTVGEPRLAEQLRTKYCKTEGAAG